MANKQSAQQCRACKEKRGRVVDSRIDENGKFVRRRYKCLNCKFRWTTYEISEKNFKMFFGLKKAFQKAVAEINKGEENDGREEIK